MKQNSVYMFFWMKESMFNKLESNVVAFYGLKSDTYLPKYQYIIHKIIHDSFNRKDEYLEKGVRLHTPTLSKVVGSNDVSTILKNLIEWRFIVRTDGYVSGLKSYSYRIDDLYRKDKLIRFQVCSRRHKDFIYKLRHTNKYETVSFPIVNYQREIFSKYVTISKKGRAYLRYKYPDLSGLIDSYPNTQLESKSINLSFEPRDFLLLKLFFTEFFVVRPDKEIRLYSNITSLKTEFRQFVLLDGEPILNTDLTNSQILFGCFVIEKHLSKNYKELPEDFIRFKKVCFDGKIYDCIADKAGMIDLLREKRGEFKKRFFKYIWFSKPRKNKPSKLFSIFQKEFPSVAASILEIKEKDYTKFPVDLQKFEAKVMLDVIGKKLKGKKIKFLTIHDSIVVNNLKDLKYAESLISQYFKENYKVEPPFKNDYDEVIDTYKLPLYKRFKPTPLYVHNEMEYQLNKKIGHLISA